MKRSTAVLVRRAPANAVNAAPPARPTTRASTIMLRARKRAFTRRAMTLTSARTLGWYAGLLLCVLVFFGIGVAQVLGDDSFDLFYIGFGEHTSRIGRGMAAALLGVESCSHLLVLYWMDKSRRDLVLQVPRHYGEARGTFALRSPARPNPIATSAVSLLQVCDCRLSVVGLDCLDGTPLIDIKPYFASTDSIPNAVVGWHASRRR